MPAFSSSVTPQSLRPGTIVSVSTYFFYRHKGTVSDRWYKGKPMVISSSARTGQVREEPWDVFSQHGTVLVEGYPGKLPPNEVIQRARDRIGSPYRLLDGNCEHLVAHAHGLEPRSPQLAVTLLLLVVGGLALAG